MSARSDALFAGLRRPESSGSDSGSASSTRMVPVTHSRTRTSCTILTSGSSSQSSQKQLPLPFNFPLSTARFSRICLEVERSWEYRFIETRRGKVRGTELIFSPLFLDCPQAYTVPIGLEYRRDPA